MKQLINILNMLIAIVKTPQETWQKLSGEYNEEQAVDALVRDYYAPLMGGGALILFLVKGLQVPDVAFSWQHAIMAGVKFIIGFYGGLFLAEFLLREVLRLFGLEFEKCTLRAFVVLAMSFCLGLDIVVNCLPGISFFYDAVSAVRIGNTAQRTARQMRRRFFVRLYSDDDAILYVSLGGTVQD